MATRLVVVHYHWQCFQTWIHGSIWACESHGYVERNMTDAEKLERLLKLGVRGPRKDFVCNGVYSCHKAYLYIAYLEDTKKLESKYPNSHIFRLSAKKHGRVSRQSAGGVSTAGRGTPAGPPGSRGYENCAIVDFLGNITSRCAAG